MATGWTIDEVVFSRDDGTLEFATDAGSGDWQLALTNLDIGNNALVVRVTSSNRGNSQVHYFNDTDMRFSSFFVEAQLEVAYNTNND